MDTITINMSSILYYIGIYYIALVILTLIFDDTKINFNNILSIFNPFRDFAKNPKECSFANIFFLLLIALIPYGIILGLIYFIQQYHFNIVW